MRNLPDPLPTLMLSSGRSLNVNIVGAGSWGGTFAQHLVGLGHNVTAWHGDPHELQEMSRTRVHPYIEGLVLDKKIRLIEVFSSFQPADIAVVAIPSQVVREVLGKTAFIKPDTTIVNLAKGIENDTLLRMSEVIAEVANIRPSKIATLSGPSHAEEVALEIPTAVVVAGEDPETIESVQQIFSSETFRIYTSTDVVGVELGGSIKNVIAIAAGICDGIGYGDNTKAALITRGIVEITRLAVAMGARPETLAGLSGMGDLVVTCLSRHSRNRHVGEELGKGRKLSDILGEMKVIAEGISTAQSIYALMEKYSVEMPICAATYRVLFEDKDPRKAVSDLMTRELVYE
ncbi:MAG: NAD(P)H-dependent glycerol-3-phosphate dehydrogenase [Candidatus Neomarinimicrobiota bacterium]